MPDTTLAEIAELVETGLDGANELLLRDYVLLTVAERTRAERLWQQGTGRWMPFVKRSIVYVMGRAAGVPRVDATVYGQGDERIGAPPTEPDPASNRSRRLRHSDHAAPSDVDTGVNWRTCEVCRAINAEMGIAPYVADPTPDSSLA